MNKIQSMSCVALIGALCLGSTIVIAADIQENAFHSPWLPDPDRTPGAINPAITQANIDQTICKKGWSTKSIRPPATFTTALKRHQLLAFRYSNRNMRSYEEDHLISLEIGGNPRDPKNLWPEPWVGKYGAHIKDKLEDRLHKLVCNHTLTLSQAQHAISTNWIEAYQKYVLNMPETATQ